MCQETGEPWERPSDGIYDASIFLELFVHSTGRCPFRCQANKPPRMLTASINPVPLVPELHLIRANLTSLISGPRRAWRLRSGGALLISPHGDIIERTACICMVAGVLCFLRPLQLIDDW